MFEQIFKNIDDLLWKDAGCSSEYRWENWTAPKTKENKLDHHKALSGDDLKEFFELHKTKADSEKVNSEGREDAPEQNSWTVNIKDLDPETFDLSVKNLNAPENPPLREPGDILREIAELDKKSAEILNSIKDFI